MVRDSRILLEGLAVLVWSPFLIRGIPIITKFSIHHPTIIRGIPLADLWQHLVIVACQNTGRRRLQMIGLILEILMLYKDNLLSSGSPSSPSSSSTVKKIDFGLLRPLWKLYYSILEDLGE